MESKLKLEVGQTYITAGGNECDIVYRNENVTDGYEFIGLVKEYHLNEKRNTNLFKDFLTKFDKNGKAAIASDIVKKKPKTKIVEMWLNHWYYKRDEWIYVNEYKTEQEALHQVKIVTNGIDKCNYNLIKTEHVTYEVEIE